MAGGPGKRFPSLSLQKLSIPSGDEQDSVALDNFIMSQLHDKGVHKADSAEEKKLQSTNDDLYKKIQDGAIPGAQNLPSKPAIYFVKDDDAATMQVVSTEKGSSAIILSAAVAKIDQAQSELALAHGLGGLVANANDPKLLEKYKPLNNRSIKKDLEAQGLSETTPDDEAFVKSYMSKVEFEMMAMSLVKDPLAAVKQNHVPTKEEKQELENQYREAAKIEAKQPKYPEELGRIIDQVKKEARDHNQTLTDEQMQDKIVDKIYMNIKKSAATPGQAVLEDLASMSMAIKQTKEPHKDTHPDKKTGVDKQRLGTLTPDTLKVALNSPVQNLFVKG